MRIIPNFLFRTISSVVFFAVMVVISCTGRNGDTESKIESIRPPLQPTASGQNVGNGGDGLRLRFLQAKYEATEILRRIAFDNFPDHIKRFFSPGELDWIIKNKEDLIQDILGSHHQWSDELPGLCQDTTCACTLSNELRGSVYLSFNGCRSMGDRLERMGALLIHESVHHLLGPNEEQADRIGVAVYAAWFNMGHPERPHWIPMDESFKPGFKNQRINPIAWADGRLLVFGENDKAGIYHPSTDKWEVREHKGGYRFEGNELIQTIGNQVIVFPQQQALYDNGAGARYDTAKATWYFLNKVGAPIPRRQGTRATADSSTFFLWGGELVAGGFTNEGVIYDLGKDAWFTLNSEEAPTPRAWHSLIYGNRKVFIWGGTSENGDESSGKIYDLVDHRWHEVSTKNAPSSRAHHGSAWTGKHFVVFGGKSGSHSLTDGGLYDPSTDMWTSISSEEFIPSMFTKVIWDGFQLIFIGKNVMLFDPQTLMWTKPSRLMNPDLVDRGESLWTGMELIQWNSDRGFAFYH